MRLTDEIRKKISSPQIDGSYNYGSWGILNVQQRKEIQKLCDTCDMFEDTADIFGKENAILKTFIKEKLDCIEIKFYEENKSIKLDTIIEFLTKREKLKIRHQVCDEIRKSFDEHRKILHSNYDECIFSMDEIIESLVQIEKGE